MKEYFQRYSFQKIKQILNEQTMKHLLKVDFHQPNVRKTPPCTFWMHIFLSKNVYWDTETGLVNNRDLATSLKKQSFFYKNVICILKQQWVNMSLKIPCSPQLLVNQCHIQITSLDIKRISIHYKGANKSCAKINILSLIVVNLAFVLTANTMQVIHSFG